MANVSLGQMNVGINFDTSSFETGLKAIQKNMSVLDSQMKVAQSSVSSFGNSTDILRTKADSLSQKIDLQKQKIQALTQEYNNSVTSKGKDATATQNLEIRLNNATTQLNKMQTELKSTRQELSNMPNSFDKMNIVMDKTNSKIGEVGKNVESIGNKLTMVFTTAITAAGAKIIGLSSDMNETLNKIDVAYKKDAQSVKDWSKTSVASMGLAQQTALDMVATYGDMSTAMGFTTNKAAIMGEQLVKRAADLSSFKNISIDVANTALTAIFTGETESLKQLGVVMTQQNLQAYAMSQGITKNIQDMSQMEQVTLRYNYVMEMTKNAQDDFKNTMGGFANQGRIVQETLKNIGTIYGNDLLPNVTEAVKQFNQFLIKINNLDGPQRKMIENGTAMIAVLGPATIGLGKITPTLSNMGSRINQAGGGLLDLTKKGIDITKTFGVDVSNGFTKTGNAVQSFASKDNIISKALNKIMSGADKVTSKIKEIAAFKIPDMDIKIPFLDNAIEKIKGYGPTVEKFFGSLGTAAMGSLGKLQSIAGLALRFVGPLALIGLALTGLGVVQQQFGPQIDQFAQIAMTKGPTIIQNLINGIVSKLPDLINNGTTMLLQFLNIITTNLPTIINGGVQILTGLIDGVVNNLDKIIPAVLNVVLVLLTALIDNLPKILDAGLKILMALVDGIVNNIDKIIDGIIQVMIAIINKIPEFLPQLINAGIKILVAIIQGLSKALPQLISYLPQIIGSVLNAFGNTDWGEIGKNIINGLVNGLKSLGHLVLDSLKNIGIDALNGFKSLFGIHSPSTVFDGFGGYMMEGLVNGLEKKKNNVTKSLSSIKSLADNAFNNYNYDLSDINPGSLRSNNLINTNNSNVYNTSNVTNSKPNVTLNIYPSNKEALDEVLDYINLKFGTAI